MQIASASSEMPLAVLQVLVLKNTWCQMQGEQQNHMWPSKMDIVLNDNNMTSKSTFYIYMPLSIR